MKTTVRRMAMADPSDVSGLVGAIDRGEIDPTRIVAIIGKTEGNGGANDFTRALATITSSRAIAAAAREPIESVLERVALVWSGGCEGVLSPHMTVFCRDDAAAPAGRGGLAVSVQRTRPIRPEEVGTRAEVLEVAAATTRALEDLGITDPADVHYVQVKGPLLTPAAIRDASARGASLVTTDPNRSKAYARGATALGVALALGEVASEAVTDDAILRDTGLYSSVASTSAGGEIVACEIVLFANAPTADDGLRIGHGSMADPIDSEGVVRCLQAAGLELDGRPDAARQARIAAVFAKATPSPNGEVRGRRTTMWSDADINYERHARAAAGAVIASVTGDPAIFVSGGTEHQCPPGSALIAAIVASDEPAASDRRGGSAS